MDKIGIQSSEEFFEMVDEFKGESDRATVILCAAKMDAMLYLLISKHLRPVTSSNDELLDGDSPLSTFSSRINLAYRLGLINAHFTKSLHLIRRIRNSFAHEVKGGALNGTGHADRIRELLIPFKKLKSYQEWRKNYFDDEEGLDKDFRLLSAIIILRLDTAVHYTEPADLDEETELIPPAWDELVDENEDNDEKGKDSKPEEKI
jgi:DNA-binding MltR family transcriptional regulator